MYAFSKNIEFALFFFFKERLGKCTSNVEDKPSCGTARYKASKVQK